MSLSARGYEQFDPEDAEVTQWLNEELTGALTKIIPSAVSKNRLAEKLSTKLNHTSRLYEQGKLKNLQHLESYLNNWIRYMKGISISSSVSLHAITATIDQLCSTKVHDLMETHFLSVLMDWVKQQKNTLNDENKQKNKNARDSRSTSGVVI